MRRRHLTESAGRELTKAAIEDIVINGNIGAWRSLVRATGADQSGRIARRVKEIAVALGTHDAKARAFAALLPRAMQVLRSTDSST